MMYKIKIPTDIVEKSVELALSKSIESRGNFFHEIRSAFKKNLEAVFKSHGLKVKPTESLSHTNYLKQGCHVKWSPIVKYTGWKGDIRKELDLVFCAKYGHGDRSMSAINYLDRAYTSLPSLSSLSNTCSIGNILLIVENNDCELDVSLEGDICSTGYAYHISKRKKKSYFALFGISFETELIASIIQPRIINHQESRTELDEIRLGDISYPMMYIDRVTGSLFTCSCFEGYFDIAEDIERLLPYGNSEEELRSKVRSIKLMDGICHFCSGGIPKCKYGHSMYFSSFLQSYLPYHNLLSRMQYGEPTYEGDKHRKIENELREQFGYPRVGQRWVTETSIYKMVCAIFPEREVIHHYRGAELEGLELDIWLPDFKVGIEYQGEQHYKVVKHWGGEAGLIKRIENDKKKKDLCDKLGYQLIEIKYSEDISELLVRDKVAHLVT